MLITRWYNSLVTLAQTDADASNLRRYVAVDPILGNNGNTAVIISLVNSELDVSFFAVKAPPASGKQRFTLRC